MTTCYLETDPALAVECANCDWRGTVAECEAISDIQERLEPGEICPAGECPSCGALAYLDPPAKPLAGPVRDLVAAAQEAREQMQMCEKMFRDDESWTNTLSDLDDALAQFEGRD